MIICVCEGQLKQKKKMHGTSHYTKYGGGGSLLMRSLYPFLRACFCVCSIPLGFHITLLAFQKLTDTCMCYVHNLDWYFICVPMLHPLSPHQIHIWKREFYWALNLNWLWFGNLAQTYKNVHPQYPFLHQTMIISGIHNQSIFAYGSNNYTTQKTKPCNTYMQD